jgi:hypothetical protein
MARADVDAEFGGLPAAPYSRRIIADDFFDDDGKAKRTGKKSYSTLRSISSFDVVDLDLLQSALFYRTHIEFCVGVWRRD